jgi:virginiamycin B lyase
MKRDRSGSFVRAVLAVACCSATLVSFMAAPPAGATEGEITQFTIPTPGSVPDGLTAAPDGDLWFAERLGDKIGRITPSGTFTEFPLQADSQPLALTVGPDGNIWFTEFESNRIGRITPSGAITEFAVPTEGGSPEVITWGPDGTMCFS